MSPEVMTETGSPQAQPIPLRVCVADGDSVFRLGLRTWLAAEPQVQIVVETDRPSEVILRLAQTQPAEDVGPGASVDPEGGQMLGHCIDLVILDSQWRSPDPDAGPALCQQLKLRYPTLPILVLTGDVAPSSLPRYWQVGVEGFWLKGIDMAELLKLIYRIAAGERVWAPDLQMLVQSDLEQPFMPTAPAQPWSPWTSIRHSLRATSLREINQSLSQLEAFLQAPQLPQWQRSILAGRCREMRAARWVVQHLLPLEPFPEPPRSTSSQLFAQPISSPERNSNVTGTQPLAPTPTNRLATASSFSTHKLMLIDAIVAKLPMSLHNQTHRPLEIDILKPQKKQDLFLTVLKQFEVTLDELRFAEVPRSQLAPKQSRILVDLWQAATTDFLGKYLTLPFASRAVAEDEIEIVRVLLQDQAIVQAEILDKIPLVVELLDHLLFQTPLPVEDAVYGVGSPEAIRQAEVLLENLVVQVANSVMQPILNRYATHDVIKQNFYDRRLLSTREIERFRNALSWNYRLRRLVTEPKQIFESQFSLVVFSESGLKSLLIYRSRDQELQQLQGIQFAVTLALETRDAIAPPLRATVTILGRGVVYLLTQVIGRGLGLVARGILQGAGNTWQDLSRGRNSQREK